jgi:DNA-binding NarL/FixJ family response regulator
MEPVPDYWAESSAQATAVGNGHPELTERELEVLRMVCEAAPDKVIARQLSVSVKTVSTHLEHIYLKLSVRGDAVNARCAAMRAAIALGLVEAPC